MGTGRFVNAQEVVISLAENMGDDWYAETPYVMKLTKLAIKKIGSKKSFISAFELKDVTDCCKIKLCENVVNVIGLLPGDQLDNCRNVFGSFRGLFKLPEYDAANPDMGNGFLYFDGPSLQQNSTGCAWKFEDGMIYFQGQFSESKATVYVKKYKTNDKGELMILDTDVDAAVAFCQLTFGRRTRWGLLENRMSTNEITQLEFEWDAKMRDARAEGSKMSVSREQELSEIMFSIDPYITIPE